MYVCVCVCMCNSNRPEKRFAFKDARLPPKPTGRSVEFKAGDSVEVCLDSLTVCREPVIKAFFALVLFIGHEE